MSISSFRVTAARFALNLSSAEELVAAADRLLTEGIYTYSLGELGTVQNPRVVSLTEVGLRFVGALAELGIPLPSAQDAVRIWADHLIGAIAEGRVSPSAAFTEFRHCILTYGGMEEDWGEVPGYRGLRDWYYQYDYAVDMAYDSAAGIEAADHRVIESAAGWLREQGRRRIEREWLSWSDGCVRRIATMIQKGGAFDDLPILADALDEAGCGDADILEHCREGGEHPRGYCWVVDLLLGQT
jgi:hypothetical protein